MIGPGLRRIMAAWGLVLATALQIQPIGVEGVALAIGCSLLPLAAGQLSLAAVRSRTRLPPLLGDECG